MDGARREKCTKCGEAFWKSDNPKASDRCDWCRKDKRRAQALAYYHGRKQVKARKSQQAVLEAIRQRGGTITADQLYESRAVVTRAGALRSLEAMVRAGWCTVGSVWFIDSATLKQEARALYTLTAQAPK